MNNLTKLQSIQKLLSALDYESSFLPKSEKGSLDMILVKFQNNMGENQSLAISLMPLNEDLEGSYFIQFYYEYSFFLQNPCPAEVKTLIQNVNRQLPLGHFNTTINWDQIYFKYIMTLPIEGSIDANHLSDVMDMILYPIQHFENEFSVFKQD